MSVTELMKPVEILLVEDNPGDVRLTKEALKEAKSWRDTTTSRSRGFSASTTGTRGSYAGSRGPSCACRRRGRRG